jgi:hypothetical protein
MRYGAYSSSEVKSSSDDDVKEKSNSSSSWEISGSFGVGGGDGVLTPSILFSAFRVSLMVIC